MPIEPVSLSLSSIAIGWIASKAKDFGVSFVDKLSDKAEEALVDWVSARFKERGNEAALKKIAEKPSSPGSRLQAEGILEEILEDNPQLEGELRKLVDDISSEELENAQKQTIEGDKNRAVQLVGDSNRVNLGDAN